MEGYAAVIVLLYWVVRGLAKGAQWLGRKAQGLNRALPAALPPAPPAALPPREPLRNITRPPGDDIPTVPMPATSAGFARQEAELLRYEDMPPTRQTASVRTAPPERSLATLFGAPDDLLRAFIMQEVLKPPRRMTAPAPDPASPPPPAPGT